MARASAAVAELSACQALRLQSVTQGYVQLLGELSVWPALSVPLAMQPQGPVHLLLVLELWEVLAVEPRRAALQPSPE